MDPQRSARSLLRRLQPRLLPTAARVLLGIALLAVGHLLAGLLQGAVRGQKYSLPRVAAPAATPGEQAYGDGDGDSDGDDPAPADPTAVLLGSLAYWGIMSGVALMLLLVLGVRVASIIAALATGAVVLGFVMQGILNDITSGIIIALTRVFFIGEVVQVLPNREGESTRDGVIGVVVGFNVINTTVLEFSTRTRITIPNRGLQESVLINHSRQPRRLVAIDVLASNTNEDFDHIAGIMAASVSAALDEGVMRRVPGSPAPYAGVYDMSEVGTKMRVSFLIHATDFTPRALNTMRLRVRSALAADGVTLVDPF